MPTLSLKANHKPIREYYKQLKEYAKLGHSHEGAVKDAFADVLKAYGKQFNWTLVGEYSIKKGKGKLMRVDGILQDEFGLIHGYWEAKDLGDDLPKWVKQKFQSGYPKDNIIFQRPDRAIFYQDGKQVYDADLKGDTELVEVLHRFFEYRPPQFDQWEKATEDFKQRIPDLARGLQELIREQRKINKKFIDAFESFTLLCKQAINPSLADAAVEEMLIQHLLTERIFCTVFNNPDFTRRNVIAVEIEKVIDALTSRAFSREAFLKELDYFYRAIEETAATIQNFSEKQHFLNVIYEKFFQGFSVKVADTHGIVYTPQPIVNFMVRSVEDILQREFGKSLSDQGVHILDPFVGTGNFIIRVMREIRKTALPYKFEHELHCNEVMLLPYYIASMNIEHEFYELTGRYQPFEGICYVDTFELAEEQQLSLFAPENTQRVERQRNSPIFVIIGNPPYNAYQVDANDNNGNRKYPFIDKQVKETYVKDSKATSKNSLRDPYIKAIRWATDKFDCDGILAFITNNGILQNLAYDGVRKHLEKDFWKVYHINLKGNARTTGKKRRMEGGNIFYDKVRVGVGITILIRKKDEERDGSKINVYSVSDYLASEAKLEIIEKYRDYKEVEFEVAVPDRKNNWITVGLLSDFDDFILLGDKESRSPRKLSRAIFKAFSNGVKTSRDEWMYNFQESLLLENVKLTIGVYYEHIRRWRDKLQANINVEDFITYDPSKIKWTRDLIKDLERGREVNFSEDKVRISLYRPFTKQYLFFDRVINEEIYSLHYIFPSSNSENENRVICVVNEAQIPFSAQIAACIPCLHYGGRQTQCFPFYVYDEDGTNRRENITDWALQQFREFYGSPRPSGTPLDKGGNCGEGFLSNENDLSNTPLDKGGRGGSYATIAQQRNLFYKPGSLPYNRKLVDRAKALRKNLTHAEKKLWYDFLRTFPERVLRQRPIDHFIVDFYCPALELVIELDGGQHFTEEGQLSDQERTAILESYGLQVLRFSNSDVLTNFEGVCRAIQEVRSPRPSGTPLDKGGNQDSTSLDEGGNQDSISLDKGGNQDSTPLDKGGNQDNISLHKGGNSGEDFSLDKDHPSNTPLIKGGRGDQITKWDIFHYVYAILHHPHYRQRYAANLKRELPRIPLVPYTGEGAQPTAFNDKPADLFWLLANAGARLAEIHVHYEDQPEYPLKEIENPDEPLNLRVEKMRLSKDKTQIKYNDFLTLAGIPPETFRYRLGNRSALDWIIDQYQITTDKRSGITNDPNRLDDEGYIVRLIKKVITISLETVKIVEGLPNIGLPQDPETPSNQERQTDD